MGELYDFPSFSHPERKVQAAGRGYSAGAAVQRRWTGDSDVETMRLFGILGQSSLSDVVLVV